MINRNVGLNNPLTFLFVFYNKKRKKLYGYKSHFLIKILYYWFKWCVWSEFASGERGANVRVVLHVFVCLCGWRDAICASGASSVECV